MSTELSPATVPKPPDDANMQEMFKWMQDMYTWATTHFPSGLLAPFFTQDQITAMTDLDQAGKIFFNHTTGKFMGGEVAAGALSVKTFTTS
jgi:hypothetical protein